MGKLIMWNLMTLDGMFEGPQPWDLMNTVPKYVFSRTLDRADWANSTLVKEDAGEAVTRLKEQPGKDLFVFGSADFDRCLLLRYQPAAVAAAAR